MRNMATIDIKTVRNLLDYDAETGLFRWRVSRGGTAQPGVVAGTRHTEGYTRINVDGNFHYAHRLAWAFVYGVQPSGEIDHINGDRADNRIVNLRDLSCLGNNRNKRLLDENRSGVCGVSWHKKAKKWMATIGVGNKQVYLGLFATVEDAKAARDAASVRYSFDPFHGEPDTVRAAREIGASSV